MALDEKQKKFIDTYLQSYAVEGAAIRAGYPKEEAMSIGIDLLNNPIIQEALKEREAQMNAVSQNIKMTKDKLLRTMYYQYNKADKMGKTNEAISILEKIANWSGLKADEVIMEPAKLIINNLDNDKI